MTVEEKISHIREAAMEEARARGNEIIDQHQKALEGVFKTHKQEAVMQADTRIKTETASARQQLNTVTSKGQLKLRRQLSRVQNELKNKLFEEVREMAEEYMKTEAYKELLADIEQNEMRVKSIYLVSDILNAKSINKFQETQSLA